MKRNLEKKLENLKNRQKTNEKLLAQQRIGSDAVAIKCKNQMGKLDERNRENKVRLSFSEVILPGWRVADQKCIRKVDIFEISLITIACLAQMNSD